jgi:hypothetical protein
MKKPVLIALSLLLLNACGRAGWATYPITERFTVRLHSPPKKVNLQGRKGLPEVPAATLERVQAFASTDDYGVYTILINPVDSAAWGLLSRDSLYDDRIQQVLLAQQGRLFRRTRFNTSAGSGIKALLDVVPPNIGKHVLMGLRVVMVRQQSCVFSFLAYSETDSSQAAVCRRRFLDSIVA